MRKVCYNFQFYYFRKVLLRNMEPKPLKFFHIMYTNDVSDFSLSIPSLVVHRIMVWRARKVWDETFHISLELTMLQETR